LVSSRFWNRYRPSPLMAASSTGRRLASLLAVEEADECHE
jgi:hypothetical protein